MSGRPQFVSVPVRLWVGLAVSCRSDIRRKTNKLSLQTNWAGNKTESFDRETRPAELCLALVREQCHLDYALAGV